jgi:hypothetical protein
MLDVLSTIADMFSREQDDIDDDYLMARKRFFSFLLC